MFSILYSVAIRLYYLAIRVYSLFNTKAARWVRGRNQIEKDIAHLRAKNNPRIWFHCASVGEFEQALPLLELLKNEYQGCEYFISFFSPSGYEYAQRKHPELSISYLPYDTSSGIDYFLRVVKPNLVFIVKYELWYRLLQRLRAHQIPTFLISGIFHPSHFMFSTWGKWYRSTLRCFTHLFLQDRQSAELLQGIGIDELSVVGDTRFDRVLEIRSSIFKDDIIEQFADRAPIFVAGSVWNTDDEVVKALIEGLPLDWKIILVPHEIAHYTCDFIGERVMRYSEFNADNNTRILLLDVMGLLSGLYRYASFAYVGGGFGRGLHNTAEAAIYQIPVLIGPTFDKFREARELNDLGLLFPIRSAIEAKSWCKRLNNNEINFQEISKGLEQYFAVNTNVSEKIIVFLKRKGYLINKHPKKSYF